MSNKPVGVAVALLLKNECVLMGERKENKIYPLHWEFPGGKIEAGETTIEALRRELREELGIGIADAEMYFSEIAPYSNGMTYGISYFLVRVWEGEISNMEFNNVEWVSKEMLPTLLHLSGNKTIFGSANAQKGFQAHDSSFHSRAIAFQRYQCCSIGIVGTNAVLSGAGFGARRMSC